MSSHSSEADGIGSQVDLDLPHDLKRQLELSDLDRGIDPFTKLLDKRTSRNILERGLEMLRLIGEDPESPQKGMRVLKTCEFAMLAIVDRTDRKSETIFDVFHDYYYRALENLLE